MRNIRRRALLASAIAVAPIMLSTVAVHAIGNPPIGVPGVNGNCLTVGGNTVEILGPDGLVVVNPQIAVQGLDCWV